MLVSSLCKQALEGSSADIRELAVTFGPLIFACNKGPFRQIAALAPEKDPSVWRLSLRLHALRKALLTHPLAASFFDARAGAAPGYAAARQGLLL